MAYTVLARKYRPQTFSDLVGQEHITRTLGNAIASGRVAHAFLFTGVRGVGKTTTARLLAKALNCANGPTAAPCGACDPCLEIAKGLDLDVLEIDGASHTGVEDVRRLQEVIPFRPARDRFKIVIVDEVHMLSTSAFNALLKTIEEPPPHLKFVFATTEPHKVPITVRSRCQRYDFRLIPEHVIAARVREILAREGIEADETTIAIVAREAGGSMRDALTLLDQVIAVGGAKLVGEEVACVLGIADRELLHRAAAATLEGNGAEVLAVVDALAQRGLDMVHFAGSLTELVRDLVVLRVAGEATDLVSLPDGERRRAIELARRIDLLELQRAFASLSLLVDEVAKSAMPRLVLEMGLVRLATRPPLRAIGEILARLEALERGQVAPSPASPGSRGTRSGGGGFSSKRSAPGDRGGAVSDELPGPISGGPSVRKAPAATTVEGASSPASEGRFASAAALSTAADFAVPDATAPSSVSTSPSGKAGLATGSPSSVQPSSVPARRTPGAPREARVSELDPGEAAARWEEIVIAIRDARPALGAVLEHATPLRLGVGVGGRFELVLGFPPNSFYAKQADAPQARDEIAKTAHRILGMPVDVRIVECAEGAAGRPTVAELEAERQRARREAARKEALSHPMVVEALAVFGTPADAVEVRIEGD